MFENAPVPLSPTRASEYLKELPLPDGYRVVDDLTPVFAQDSFRVVIENSAGERFPVFLDGLKMRTLSRLLTYVDGIVDGVLECAKSCEKT